MERVFKRIIQIIHSAVLNAADKLKRANNRSVGTGTSILAISPAISRAT